MTCAWDALLGILPTWLKPEVDMQYKSTLQEIRLRLNHPVQLCTQAGGIWLSRSPQKEDLQFVLSMASKYSPWASGTTKDGYLTSLGGHRIGICGECVCQNGVMSGFRTITSLCIRVARDFTGISPHKRELGGSVLIIGPPGSGKTTLLRDMLRTVANEYGAVTVVDERGELFPLQSNFCVGKQMDVLTGCTKPHGIEIALKTMNPGYIGVDEITSYDDCVALEQIAWCGVKVMATAHAHSRQDLLSRKVYHPLVEKDIFDEIYVLHKDKTWHRERGKG